MGIFSHHVMRYYQSGLVCVPCEKKAPILGESWQRWCDEMPNEDLVENWESRFDNANQIGLLLGAVNGLCAFDFDYEWNDKKCKIKKSEFDKDRKLLETQILALLPQTPCIKTGKKGWTRFYRMHTGLANDQVDRNGLRLFDFLAFHKQTIIPPSAYEENIYYRWLGVPVDECFDDIPYIDQDVVSQLKLLMRDKKGYDFEGNGRHGVLFKWLLDVVRLEHDDLVVAKLLIERDKKLNSLPYLSDEKHFRAKPQENALKWISRVRKFVEESPPLQMGGEGWDYFFESSFSDIKKDIISKNVFFKYDAESPWAMMNAAEGTLRSYADRKGLKSAKVKDEFDRWALEHKKCDFLCDIPEWDQVDRLALFGGAIKSARFSSEEITEILKQWGSNIFRRVQSSQNQNRCIILKGPQGIGKDYLVRAMLKDFVPYYESTTMPGTQKDALEICSRLLAVHIEEFDQTKKMDVSFMKSLITQPSAFFRESYGASPNQKITRPSFISTANVDDILRDPTGNRRFIIIPVDSIEWGYPEESSLQVVAQWKHYFATQQFTGLAMDLEAKIKRLSDEYTPEGIEDLIVSVYRSKIGNLTAVHNLTGGPVVAPYPHSYYLTFDQVAVSIADVAKMTDCSVRRVLSTLKHQGLSKRYSDGVRYFKSKDEADKIQR